AEHGAELPGVQPGHRDRGHVVAREAGRRGGGDGTRGPVRAVGEERRRVRFVGRDGLLASGFRWLRIPVRPRRTRAEHAEVDHATRTGARGEMSTRDSAASTVRTVISDVLNEPAEEFTDETILA